MNTFFDYIFYRTAELFYKRGGRRGLQAISIITVTQTLVIGVIINLIADQFIAKTTRELHYKEFGYVGAVITVLLMYINYRKYEGMYNKLRFKWKEEEPTKRFFKGVLVVILIILPPIALTIQSHLIH